MNEFRIFLKYVFNIKGFIEGFVTEIQKLFHPRTFSAILLFISFYFLLLKKDTLTFSFFIILTLIVRLRLIYKSGDHIHWNRQEQLLKIKEKDGTK